MYETIAQQARQAVLGLLEAAKLEKGDILVVGCSSSEVGGHKIGSCSSTEIADVLFSAIYPPLRERGIYLAAQCCEHLNRAVILPRQAAQAYGLERVNVIPQPKAGGSFATAAWRELEDPVAVESLNHQARAGIDIGDTLIGMHLARVAVPVRLELKKIGEANLVCARVRAPFVGGSRAVYEEKLL